jgi:hypothetical protein
MNLERSAVLHIAHQLPPGGIQFPHRGSSVMVIMRAVNAYRRKDKRCFPLWSTRVMKNYAPCHNPKNPAQFSRHHKEVLFRHLLCTEHHSLSAAETLLCPAQQPGLNERCWGDDADRLFANSWNTIARWERQEMSVPVIRTWHGVPGSEA